jgi:hypothetical protein
MKKVLDKDIYIKNLEMQVTLFAEHSQVLGELLEHIEQDFSRKEDGTEHLWNCVDEGNELLMGPSRAYVNQD